MMKEYGGYLPLELNEREEYFDRFPAASVARFNCGRSAIVAAVKAVKPRKLYIPFYNCVAVRDALDAHGIAYEQYLLDNALEPRVETLGEGEWILYVNYFGTSSKEKKERIAAKYKNVIFDNTQAFYTEPILDGSCMNVYSPRKFIGLIDGGYLVWSGGRDVCEDYPVDVSWERGAFLLKSIELGTNAAYRDNLDSKECFAGGIRRMSVLTQRMLRSVDYDELSARRDENYRTLIERFGRYNQLELPMEGYAPFVYPLLIEDPELRRKIVGKKIYVPQWWKYLLDEVPEDSVEARLSRWLLPLPVDHRYTQQDMTDMADEIVSCIESRD